MSRQVPVQPEKNPLNDPSRAQTGNASNPSPDGNQPSSNQLLDEKADTYIREAGNIEDLPDAKEQEDMEQVIRNQE